MNTKNFNQSQHAEASFGLDTEPVSAIYPVCKIREQSSSGNSTAQNSIKVKNISFIILFIFYAVTTLGQNLNTLSSPEIRETIRDMKFINNETGWLSCNKGIIYKTTNGGKNWIEQFTGTEKDLTKISFINDQTGWAAAIDGSLFKTSDGGSTWNEFNYALAVPGMVFSICDLVKFIDENTGFILAGKLKQIYLLKSSDGGSSWSVKDSLVSSVTRKWYDIDFNGSHGVIVGDKKDIQKCTSDFGDTWTFSTSINDNFFRDLKYVKFLSPTEVIAMGEGNEFSGVPVPVYKSFDSGVNWVKKNQSLTTVFDRVKGAYFKNNIEGIGVGSDGFSKAFVVKTTDGGESWNSAVLDFAFGLQSISGSGDSLFALGTLSHLIYSTDFGETWHLIPNKIQTSIISINFINGKGYAITRNGDIYFSSDGTGNSWEYLSHAGKNLSGAVTTLPNDNILILKENRHIVKSDDFGLTWKTVLEPVYPSARNIVGGLDFGDLNTGYAWFSLNDYGEYYIYKTTDGGENWNQLKSLGGPGYISGNLLAFDADNAVILGPDQWVQRTGDGGITWEAASLNNFPPDFLTNDFEDATKIDENRAVAIGEKFICITSDKGVNWNYLEHGFNDIDSGFYKIAFSSDTLGYISLAKNNYSNNGIILKTTDLGLSWTKNESLKDQYFLFAAAINENGKVFFGTSTGFILGEETVSSIKDKNLINNFSLKQNYPNPFNPATTLSFVIDKTSFVKLTVFDVLGNAIASIVNKELSAGEYKYQWNAYGIVSGVYYYRLSAAGYNGEYSETKKMLLIK